MPGLYRLRPDLFVVFRPFRGRKGRLITLERRNLRKGARIEVFSAIQLTEVPSSGVRAGCGRARAI